MDSGLVKIYRIIYADIILIYDCAFVYSQLPLAGRNLEEYGDGLSILLKIESELEKNDVGNSNIDKWEDFKKKGHHSASDIAYEFYHGVFLQFIFEELSQYPFWLMKVSSISSAGLKNLSLVEFYRFVFAKLKKHGVVALFKVLISI